MKVFKITSFPVLSLFVLGCEEYYGQMGIHHNHMLNFPGGGAIMLLLWIVLIGAIAYSLYYISKDKNFKKQDSSLNILKKRYANGEISKEEFIQMKKDLE